MEEDNAIGPHRRGGKKKGNRQNEGRSHGTDIGRPWPGSQPGLRLPGAAGNHWRMKTRSPRLAVRALILHEGRLLLVNAYPGGRSDLWCAPGGGVEPGQSLPDNLRREIHEETGLEIAVGSMVLVNEFHDPASGFHQVDLYFRAVITRGAIDPSWIDPAGVVTERRLFSAAEMSAIRYKPDLLATVAFGDAPAAAYDPLEPIVA